MAKPINRMLRWFASAHLPADLQPVSSACEDLALSMDALLPEHPETTAGLRKLLEAKDCFVRARIAGLEEDGARDRYEDRDARVGG